MPIDAATLRVLMAAGLAGEALLAAVEQIDDYRRQLLRRGASERQRRRRDQLSHAVTRDGDIDSAQQKRRALTSWPADFVPDLLLTPPSWSNARARQEVERFRDYALANDRRYRDWAAAWRNWVRSPLQVKANGAHRETPTERGDRLIAEAKRLEREAGLFDHDGSDDAG
jgi:hypothetical protein